MNLNQQQKATVAGFILVAAVLGYGLWRINRSLVEKSEKLNTSIRDLPAGLKRALLGY